MSLRYLLAAALLAMVTAIPLGCGQPSGPNPNQPVVTNPPPPPPPPGGDTQVHVNRSAPGGGLHIDVKKSDGSEPVDIDLPPRRAPAEPVSP